MAIIECTCPHCKNVVRIRKAQKPGKYKYVCPSCKQPFAVTFQEEEPPSILHEKEKSSEEQTSQQSEDNENTVGCFTSEGRYNTIGGLVEKRKGLFKKDRVHPLAERKIIIGRKNDNFPSDIMFDDRYMSRQSLELTVEKQEDARGQYFTYVLKVLRQRNPILHNGEPLSDGEEIVLHLGDTITVGKTVLILN